MRDRPLAQKLFFALILVTIVATPVLLLVAGDDEYEGLEVRSARLTTLPGEARVAIVLDNDGDRRVRITDVALVKPDATARRIADVDARYNPRGEGRVRLRRFARFEMAPQQRRFVEIFRELGTCGEGAEIVRDVRLTFEVFGGSQERVLRLPGALALPRCA